MFRPGGKWFHYGGRYRDALEPCLVRWTDPPDGERHTALVVARTAQEAVAAIAESLVAGKRFVMAEILHAESVVITDGVLEMLKVSEEG